MNNLFENITNRILDRINFLSSNIQEYLFCKTSFNNIYHIEEETKTKEKQLQHQETYFDKLYEVYQRTKIVIDCEETFKQLFEEFNRLTNGYFVECKEQRIVVGNKMKKLLKEMKENEKIVRKEKQIETTEIYQQRFYDDFIIEIEKEVKENKENERMENEEKEKEEMEKSMKESDIKERNHWKQIKLKEKEDQKKKEEEKKKKKEENKQKRIGMMKDILNENELQLIENMIGRQHKNILFNSDKDDWSLKKSTFFEKVKNKSHFVIVIQTTEGKKFGCYMRNCVSTVDTFSYDPNAFLFNLKNENIEKYQIKSFQTAFAIYKQSFYGLFTIGNSDIFIYKSDGKSYCVAKQMSFDYNGKQNALIEKENGIFEVKKFIVIQMKMTLEEQSNNALLSEIMTTDSETHIIENWCNMTLKKIIFDSENDDWSKNTSIFDEKVFGKENLVFLIEDKNRNVFGGFIRSSINDKKVYKNGMYKGKKIDDLNSFVFSLRSNGRLQQPEKFEIKNDESE